MLTRLGMIEEKRDIFRVKNMRNGESFEKYIECLYVFSHAFYKECMIL